MKYVRVSNKYTVLLITMSKTIIIVRPPLSDILISA